MAVEGFGNSYFPANSELSILTSVLARLARNSMIIWLFTTYFHFPNSSHIPVKYTLTINSFLHSYYTESTSLSNPWLIHWKHSIYWLECLFQECVPFWEKSLSPIFMIFVLFELCHTWELNVYLQNSFQEWSWMIILYQIKFNLSSQQICTNYIFFQENSSVCLFIYDSYLSSIKNSKKENYCVVLPNAVISNFIKCFLQCLL